MSAITYYIRHIAHRDLFWSNGNGWVDWLSADTFTLEERKERNLPMEGEWLVLQVRT